MKPDNVRPRPGPMLLLLALLLTGCAASSPPSPPPAVKPPAIPPLPLQARQPATPSECLPTCLSGVIAARESWLRMLTPPDPPASPASAPTKP